MPEPTRNIEEEMELVAHPVYGPLFLKFKKAFRERLKHPGEYLPAFYETGEVAHLLGSIAGESALGEAILDLLAYSALQIVIEQDKGDPPRVTGVEDRVRAEPLPLEPTDG